MCKFNYIWLADNYNRSIVITFAYEKNAYAFAIKSSKDQHVKKIGRIIAKNRLYSDKFTGKKINFKGKSDSPVELWIQIKEDFLNRLYSGNLDTELPKNLRESYTFGY